MNQWVLGTLQDVELRIHHQFLYVGSLINCERLPTGGYDPRNNEQDKIIQEQLISKDFEGKNTQGSRLGISKLKCKQ